MKTIEIVNGVTTGEVFAGNINDNFVEISGITWGLITGFTAATSGTSGSSGSNGTSGSSGTNGTNGTSGSSGTDGTNGTSGSSGVNGTSGSSGTDGTNGTSGSSGVNGTSGSSGTSGSFLIDQIDFNLKGVITGTTIRIRNYSSYNFDISGVSFTTNSGTCDIDVKNNGSSVTGMVALTGNTTDNNLYYATAGNTVSVGSYVSIYANTLTDCTDIFGTLKIIRT